MWLVYLPVVILVAYCTYLRYFHPLSQIPGPFLASISPLWITWQGANQRRPRLDLELHKKYGSVVRIAPDQVIFSNAAYFRQIYGAGTTFERGRFYEVLTDGSAGSWDKLDMLAESNTEKLRVQKRYAGPVYSTPNVKRHEHLIDNNIQRGLTRWASLKGQPVDMYHEFELFNIDNLCELTYAQPYGAVERGTDEGHMAGMDKKWEWYGWIGYLPWLCSVDKWWKPATAFVDVRTGSNKVRSPLFPFLVSKLKELDKRLSQGEQATRCIFDDLRQLTKDKPAFVKKWGTSLSITDLGAGVDTISWTLTCTVVGISSNKPVLVRLLAELDEAVRAGEISVPVGYDEAAKLPYLQACLQESMRMWPNIAIALPRMPPKEGIEIDGYYIPYGCTVGLNSKQLGQSEHFGPEPEIFKPERWLEAGKLQRNDMETRNLAFGSPSRKCPGMHLAWVVMSKVLASFYLEFDLKVLNEMDGPPGPGGNVWREKGSYPTKWHGLEVELTPRQTDRQDRQAGLESRDRDLI